MKNQISEELIKIVKSKGYIPCTLPELGAKLGLGVKHLSPLKKTLSHMLKSGDIVKVKGDKYAAATELDLISGKIEFLQRGGAKLFPKDGSSPVEIRQEDTSVALSGDTVLARISHDKVFNRNFRGKQKASKDKILRGEIRRGKVIRILERSNSPVIGTLRRNYNLWHLVPDNPKFYYDIIVADPSHSGISPTPAENDKVAVELNDWTQRHINPSGRIIENFGASHTPMSEYKAILSKYELDTEFPDDVIAEVKNLPAKVDKKDLSGRLDLRDEFTITIDPVDAKDFDDAVSLRRKPEGEMEIGIHIADVTHYVKQNSRTDKEARRRGNSTYLVGTVIPMLPFELSNGICSLVEGEDRLVKSVFLSFDGGGDCTGVSFANSVIRSVKRLSYEQAYAFLKENDLNKIRQVKSPAEYETKYAGKSLEELDDVQMQKLRTMIRRMWSLASTLRRRRMKKGSLDLEMPEVKIFCDKEGYADRIESVEHNEAHQLIEEFMLAANEAVAREMWANRQPYISRVHDDPDPEKLAEFREWIESFGINCGDMTARREVMRILNIISKHPQSHIMKTKFLRSLKRAVYRASPDGHYGLCKTYYAHFTSPIRRYADFTVHHNFTCMMRDRKSPTFMKSNLKTIPQAMLEGIAEHISRTENNSTEAERESRKIKLLEYFERALESGKSFEGIIVSLTNHGFFVELCDSSAFGFVHMHTLHDDIYKLSSDGSEMRGRQTGKSYKVGNKIMLETEHVDRFKRQIDFRPANSGEAQFKGRQNNRNFQINKKIPINKNHNKRKKFRR